MVDDRFAGRKKGMTMTDGTDVFTITIRRRP
jgi:hypothetical protein